MKKKWIGIVCLLVCGAGILAAAAGRENNRVYSARELGIKELKSAVDRDGDGLDDYTDILLGAREYVESDPGYESRYYKGGYPDDGYGVCTDVIWYALQSAGYSLKDLVDEDIVLYPERYPLVEQPDPNIDFRRVKNLNLYLAAHAQSLTIDLKEAEQWQAGDIVVFQRHIAVCSDKRNRKGMPFIIHHGPAGAREKNEIEKYKIIGHYRWNMEEVP